MDFIYKKSPSPLRSHAPGGRGDRARPRPGTRRTGRSRAWIPRAMGSRGGGWRPLPPQQTPPDTEKRLTYQECSHMQCSTSNYYQIIDTKMKITLPTSHLIILPFQFYWFHWKLDVGLWSTICSIIFKGKKKWIPTYMLSICIFFYLKTIAESCLRAFGSSPKP